MPVSLPGSQAAIRPDGQDAGGAERFGDVLARLQPAAQAPEPPALRSAAAPARRHSGGHKEDTDASPADAAGVAAMPVLSLERQPIQTAQHHDSLSEAAAAFIDERQIGLPTSASDTAAQMQTTTSPAPRPAGLARADQARTLAGGIEKADLPAPGSSPAPDGARVMLTSGTALNAMAPQAQAPGSQPAIDLNTAPPTRTRAATATPAFKAEREAAPDLAAQPPAPASARVSLPADAALSAASQQAQAPSPPPRTAGLSAAHVTATTADLKTETGIAGVPDAQAQASASAVTAMAGFKAETGTLATPGPQAQTAASVKATLPAGAAPSAAAPEAPVPSTLSASSGLIAAPASATTAMAGFKAETGTPATAGAQMQTAASVKAILPAGVVPSAAAPEAPVPGALSVSPGLTTSPASATTATAGFKTETGTPAPASPQAQTAASLKATLPAGAAPSAAAPEAQTPASTRSLLPPSTALNPMPPEAQASSAVPASTGLTAATLTSAPIAAMAGLKAEAGTPATAASQAQTAASIKAPLPASAAPSAAAPEAQTPASTRSLLPPSTALNPMPSEAQASSALSASPGLTTAPASATTATAGFKTEAGTPAPAAPQAQAQHAQGQAQAPASARSLLPPSAALNPIPLEAQAPSRAQSLAPPPATPAPTAVPAYEGRSYASDKALAQYLIQSGGSAQRAARLDAPPAPGLAAASLGAGPASPTPGVETDLRTSSNAGAQMPATAMPDTRADMPMPAAASPVPPQAQAQAQVPTDTAALSPLPATATPAATALPASEGNPPGSGQALMQYQPQPGSADPRRADKAGAAPATAALTAAPIRADSTSATAAFEASTRAPSRSEAPQPDAAILNPGAPWLAQQAPAAPQGAPGVASPAPLPTPVTTGSLAPQVGSQEWGHALGKHLAHMSSSGPQTAELQLNPPGLGPLKITLSLNEHQVQAMFVSAHAQVRSAVEAALPELRNLLADSGISLGQTSVGAESQPQTAFGQAQGEPSPGRRYPGAPAIESAASAAPVPAPAMAAPERPGQGGRISLYA